MSLPVRGAWIEIVISATCVPRALSLPVRGAWIEIVISATCVPRALSLPVRGAWIEINRLTCSCKSLTVAPRAGSVD